MQRIKTKVLAASALCALVLMPALHSAVAENKKLVSIVECWKKLYMRVELGRGFWNKKSSSSKRPKTVDVIGAGVGYRFFNYPLKLEFSAYKNSFNVSGSSNTLMSARTISYIVNVYRDIVLAKDVTGSSLSRSIIPYFIAGIGSAYHSSIKGIKLSKSNKAVEFRYDRKKRFAWNAGAGAKFHIDKVWTVDLMCKYVDLGSIPAGSYAVKARGYQAVASAVMNFW